MLFLFSFDKKIDLFFEMSSLPNYTKMIIFRYTNLNLQIACVSQLFNTKRKAENDFKTKVANCLCWQQQAA